LSGCFGPIPGTLCLTAYGQIVLDVCSPGFFIADYKWRSSLDAGKEQMKLDA
jgi:hypothetical protein